MTEILTPQSLPTFRERFQNFYDGVIRRLAFEFTRDAAKRTAQVDVMIPDKALNGDWAICTLTVSDLDEFIVQHGRLSFLVLSDGVKYVWAENKVFVDFATVEDEPTVAEIRSGGFYLAGRVVSWSARPLSETEWQ